MPPGGERHPMSDVQHPGDTDDEPHGSADHGTDHGHDDHAHADEPLGPIDVQAWGALMLGAALGLIVAVCIAFSTSPV